MTWPMVLRMLTGEPMPPLPALPGRLMECRDEPLELTEAERAELLASDAPDVEVAAVLTVSRSRVGQLRAAARVAAGGEA